MSYKIKPPLNKEYVSAVLTNAYSYFMKYGEIIRSDIIGNPQDGHEIVFVIRPDIGAFPDIRAGKLPKDFDGVKVTVFFVGGE